MGENLIVGFLCIDTPKHISKSLLDELQTYTTGFANALSGFFHEVSIMDMKIVSSKKDRTKEQIEYLNYLKNTPENDGVPTSGRWANSICIGHMKRMVKSGKSAEEILAYQRKKLAEFSNAVPDIMHEDDPFYKYLHSDMIPETFM